MNDFGLTSEAREMVCTVLEQHREITEARIFGSRAKGNFQPNSDIDLVLYGAIPLFTLASIAGALEELPLPYLFDVEAYNSIRHEPLREHIDRAGKIFYARA